MIYFIVRLSALHEHVYHMHANTVRGIGFFGTGIRDRGELPCGCWETSAGLLHKQPVTLNSESSLQPNATVPSK